VSLGLAPAVVDGFYQLLPRIQESGVAILLVEQDIDRALAASDRALCLLEGRVVMAGDSAGLDRDRLVSAYFGAPSAPGAAATKTAVAPVLPDDPAPPPGRGVPR
jgi:branched-chain amino acid transport system ATP-binding protein